MAEITLPFLPRWKEPMLSGQKRCTSRTKPYGEIGDTFTAFGSIFRIIRGWTLPLSIVVEQLYDVEGCKSPDDFRAVWRELHPRKGFVAEQKVWVHWFERVKEAVGDG